MTQGGLFILGAAVCNKGTTEEGTMKDNSNWEEGGGGVWDKNSPVSPKANELTTVMSDMLTITRFN